MCGYLTRAKRRLVTTTTGGDMASPTRDTEAARRLTQVSYMCSASEPMSANDVSLLGTAAVVLALGITYWLVGSRTLSHRGLQLERARRRVLPGLQQDSAPIPSRLLRVGEQVALLGLAVAQLTGYATCRGDPAEERALEP